MIWFSNRVLKSPKQAEAAYKAFGFLNHWQLLARKRNEEKNMLEDLLRKLKESLVKRV